jgi:uncharacterized protein (TIGR02147 family)
MTRIGEPDLYSYLDYRQYLQDWFLWKKTVNPRYSHRLFARKAGQRSPSLLLHVIEGRRNLTPLTTHAFATAMSLGERKRTFFEHLVALKQAELPKDREKAMDDILATKRFHRSRKLDGELFRVFGEWHYGAICELAHCEGFQPDPQWIAKTLRPTISVKRAKQALETLLSLGLLRRNKTGDVKPTDEWIMPEGNEDIAILKYHQAMLAQAKIAVSEFTQEHRIALGFTGSLPKNAIPKLQDKMTKLFNDMASACEQEPKQVVYQLSFVLFPLSDPETTNE